MTDGATVVAGPPGVPAEAVTEGAEDVVDPDDGVVGTPDAADSPVEDGVPLGDPEGLTVPSGAERVFPRLSCRPSAGEPEVKDRPATSAASDTAPTAPTATANRRERPPPVRRAARRRSARPPATGSPARRGGPAAGTRGSRWVSSYAFCHPCAAAGSAYCSYDDGSGSASGWYTIGRTEGAPLSPGLDMAAHSRYRRARGTVTGDNRPKHPSRVVENTPHGALPGRKLPDMQVIQSTKLANVCYEIRGPVLEEAMRLEAAGHRILKLNTGNPAAFGFEAPPEILEDVLRNVSTAHGYGDAKGLLAARRAVVMHNQTLGIETDVEHVFVGNGVSELIVMAMQGLLDDGDEVLVPSPDYPLWTAAVSLSGGTAVHYRCDEQSDWMPDLADVERKVTDRTKAIVIINPNNPTGAVYDEAMVRGLTDIARRHNLLVCSDEIYDKILYDGATHTPTAAVAPDLLTLTFNGMSKAYRVAGYRVGWMSISGPRAHADSYIEGLTILANMRLCANMPGQHGVVAALSGRQSINDLVLPGGRLKEQMDTAYELLTQIPGVTCVRPKGALYLFPRLDPTVFKIKDDRQMVLDLLRQEKIMVVQGTGFNWPEPDHFRVVTLPTATDLRDAVGRIARFLDGYGQP